MRSRASRCRPAATCGSPDRGTIGLKVVDADFLGVCIFQPGSVKSGRRGSAHLALPLKSSSPLRRRRHRSCRREASAQESRADRSGAPASFAVIRSGSLRHDGRTCSALRSGTAPHRRAADRRSSFAVHLEVGDRAHSSASPNPIRPGVEVDARQAERGRDQRAAETFLPVTTPC